jgi:anti-anti-sigma factor
MESLELEVIEDRPAPRVVRLRGPLTINTLFEFLSEARRNHFRPIIVDATEVPYMDSAGLGSLLGIFASCERHGHKLIVAGACERVQVLLRVTHVERVLMQAADIEAAEAMLGKVATA